MRHPSRSFRTAILVALTCAVAACHVPDTIMENGAIRLYRDTVTLHVAGSPEATLDADGGFAIDGKAVPVTPAERSLLAQYVRSVQAVHETGLSMGKTGIGMAVKAVSAAVSSSSGHADEAAQAGSERIQQLDLDICKDTAAIQVAQDRLAAQLAAFKPYASIVGASNVTDCVKDAKD